MLIIIERDAAVRKRLCDLLNRERILGVDTVTAALERLCQFREDIDLIIARIGMAVEIREKQVIKKICDKLYIKIPPIICYFSSDEGEIATKFEKEKTTMFEYDENDTHFPFKYINAIKEKYPALNYDIKRANETWQGKLPKKPEGMVDPRVWLEEQGLIEVIKKVEAKQETRQIDQTESSAHELLKEDNVNENHADYEKLYFELRERFEKLLKYLDGLKDFMQR
jgi:hypothetical protein